MPLLLLGLMAGASFFLGYQLLPVADNDNENNSEIVTDNPQDNSPVNNPLPEKEEPQEEEKVQSPQPQPEETPITQLPSEEETIDNSPETPSKPQPVTPPSQPDIPQNRVSAIGMKATQLSQKWGQPSSKYLAYGDRVTVLAYDSPLPNIEQIKYLVSNNDRQIVQVELFVSPNSGLNVITDGINQSIQGKVSREVEKAINEVLLGKTDLRSFFVGDYQGMVQKRNQTIEIRVWNRQFSL